jgi:hypothetical protein
MMLRAHRSTRARLARATGALAVAGTVLLSASLAHATGGDACARAAEEGQRMRDESKLRAARAKFLECGADSCPDIIRSDCARWLAELDAALPTLSIRARDSRGQDVSGARLDIDGAVALDAVRGQSVQLDPGEHTLVLTARAGDRLEQHVVVVRGERDRIVTFAFARPLATDGTAPGDAIGPPTNDAGSPSYTAPIVVGAVAVVALATFGILDLHANGRYRDLRDGCGTTRSCASDDVSSVHGELVGAAVALGVGVVATGIATYLFLSAPRPGAPRAAIVPLPGGGAASLQGTF